MMKNIFEDEVDCKRILREITLLRKLDHPNIVKIIEILEPKEPHKFTTLFVVMDYMESDLKKVIRSPINLELAHVQTILYRLCQSVKHLHDVNVLHRDIKPANVLIKEDCSIKLCDFGLARELNLQAREIDYEPEVIAIKDFSSTQARFNIVSPGKLRADVS